MRMYFVDRKIISYSSSKRASVLHMRVFHGRSSYPDERVTQDWRPPALTNRNRNPVHISRSGRYVPPIFGDRSYELIVNETIKERLSRLPNVEFVEVVFERLIDWSMPALGDFSEFDTDPPRDVVKESEQKLLTAPDVPEFHRTIGRYYSLLGANLHDMKGMYDDIQEIQVNFGSYVPPTMSMEPIVSARALNDYPFLWGNVHIFREDAFEIIAPYLDLDYYGIAFLVHPPRREKGRFVEHIERLMELHKDDK